MSNFYNTLPLTRTNLATRIFSSDVKNPLFKENLYDNEEEDLIMSDYIVPKIMIDDQHPTKQINPMNKFVKLMKNKILS